MMPMFVSVIVATRNRQPLLRLTLLALLEQEWPRDRYEIIVADNGSTDDTRDLVERHVANPDAPPVRYLYVTKPGKSYAVNAALAEARGEVIALTDDDVQPGPKWIASLVRAVQETDADFVAGRIEPIWEIAPPDWVSSELYGVLAVPDNGDRRIPIVRGSTERVMAIGANMALRRRVVERIGGLRLDLGKLDGSLRTGEDHEFFLRMLHVGCTGIYEPDAVVRHWVPRERLQRGYFRRWLYQNGRDVARLERVYPSAVRTLFGVPRYLFRSAASAMWTAARAAARGDHAARFAAGGRVAWLGGYFRESWWGGARGQASHASW